MINNQNLEKERFYLLDIGIKSEMVKQYIQYKIKTLKKHSK